MVIVVSSLSSGALLGVNPVHAVPPNSAKVVLRCQGLLPATSDCNSTSLTPFETIIYDSDNDGRYSSVDPIIVGPTPANGTILKNDPKIQYRDIDSNNHWDSTEPIFYDTNSTLQGRVFLYGSPTIYSGFQIKTDPKIRFVDTDGNGVLDGVVAVTARLEDLGGTLSGGTQQDVGSMQIIYSFDPTLLQVICTSTPCATVGGTGGGSVLSGQFDAWCVTNSLFCNPAAGKYTYLVDNYCSAATGSTFDKVAVDNSLGKVSSSSLCGATGSYDYGLGCDPATRNATLVGTCPGDITHGGVGALSNLDALRVEFMIVGTGSTSINQVKPATGVSGTQLIDIDGITSTQLPVAMFNATFSNGSNVPPVAKFTYSPANVLIGQPVSFDATGSYDPDGTITSYQWNFGDGATASGSTASHGYANRGNYTVSLTVTDNGGATNTMSQTIRVISNLLPTALFTITPSQPLINQTVTFNATLSSDPNGLSLSYSWEFGDGSTSTATVATHSYRLQGAYLVMLTVTNTRNLSASASKGILVTRLPYLPGVKVGDWATFLASGSLSATHGLVLATINVTRVVGTNVTFTSTLFYMNGTTIHQSDSTVSVLVFNGLLIPANLAAGDILSSPVGFSSVTINKTITGIFAGAVRPANQLSVNYAALSFSASLSAEWDQASGILLGLNSTSSPGPGQTDTEHLLLVDTNIWSATLNRLPVPVFTWKPLYGTVGQSISFNATRSYDPDAGDHIVSYNWHFGDGNSTTTVTPTVSHTYSTTGSFSVTLTVTDTVGGSFGFGRALTVLLPLTIVVTPTGPITGALPLRVDFTSTVSGGLSPYAYFWDFGDHQNSTIANPSHTYTAQGSLTVKLTVTDSRPGTISTSLTIVVVSSLFLTLVASQGPYRAPTTIAFTTLTSGGSTPYIFSWSAPAGSPFSASGANLNVTYTVGGKYTVSVTVTDNNGITATNSITVTVSPALTSLKILVKDSSGSPLPRATVKLYSATQNLVGQDTTATDGSVTFSNLLPGEYSYVISYGNYQSDSKTVTISEGVPQSNTVNLATVIQPAPSPVNYLLYTGVGLLVLIIGAVAVLSLRRRRRPTTL